MTDTVDRLIKYAHAEGSELGDFLLNLCHVDHWVEEASVEFSDAYYKEVRLQLDHMEENFTLVMTETKHTVYTPELRDKA